MFDDCALSYAVREEMYKCYPDAKRAHLKSGGNFPYLSRSAEVNIFIQVNKFYWYCLILTVYREISPPPILFSPLLPSLSAGEHKTWQIRMSQIISLYTQLCQGQIPDGAKLFASVQGQK